LYFKLLVFILAPKMSQQDLASIADLDRTYISGLERGKRNPT